MIQAGQRSLYLGVTVVWGERGARVKTGGGRTRLKHARVENGGKAELYQHGVHVCSKTSHMHLP